MIKRGSIFVLATLLILLVTQVQTKTSLKSDMNNEDKAKYYSQGASGALTGFYKEFYDKQYNLNT